MMTYKYKEMSRIKKGYKSQTPKTLKNVTENQN